MLRYTLCKRFLLWLFVLSAFIVALPNILPHRVLACLPQWYAGLQLPMGLDLRGGSRLVIQVPRDQAALRDAIMHVMTLRLQHSRPDLQDFTVARQGRDQILVEVPGFFNAQFLKDILTVRAHFSLYEQQDNATIKEVMTGKARLPAGMRFVYSSDDPPVAYLVASTAIVTNKHIVSAGILSAKGAEEAELHILLDEAAARRLNHAIAAGHTRQFVAVMDDEALQPLHLASQVQGNLLTIGPVSASAAKNLASLLKYGPLAADVSLLEERTIGAELGDDYARSGLVAAGAALVIVALFMVLCYGVAGVMADLAFAVHIALLLALLTVIGSALTLAGFAGLVLTIGLSVDASILIFERIREDHRQGRALSRAIASGFTRASSTIIDANVTVLIAALVLFLLGDGPVHGFAMAVTAGVLTCLFTTLSVLRLMVCHSMARFDLPRISASFLRFIPAATQIGFMQLRHWTLGLAAILTLAGFALWVGVGIHYGIDFSGGSVAVLQARNGHADIYDIAARANDLNIDQVHVEAVRNPARALLTIRYQGIGNDGEQSVAARLRGEFNADYQFERMDVVGPAIAGSLSRSGILAVLVSLAAIFAYLWLRFSGRFAVGAMLTTAHDMVVLIGLFVFFQWEFNLWSIAAILAVIGYSLNDTIVIYDRIRALIQHKTPMKMTALVDRAINRTLSRTILTSLAMLLAHIPLYYYGGQDMRHFASILLIGIVIATYSSIFIAGPLMVWLGARRTNARQARITQ